MLKTPANDAHPPQGGALSDGAPFSETLLTIGREIFFSEQCPLSLLAGQRAIVACLRTYRFGEDVIPSYQLQLPDGTPLMLAIARDAQGEYLAFSRSLTAQEQDRWFGRDALSFFTEPSTAKTIRCKVDLNKEGAWAGERYSKAIDWVEGVLESEGAPPSLFRYNLLLTENHDKALEIEHDTQTSENRVYVTTYRPLSDIARCGVVVDAIPAPTVTTPPAPSADLVPPIPEIPPSSPWQLLHPQPRETAPSPAFTPSSDPYQKPSFKPIAPSGGEAPPVVPPAPARQDFRRVTEEEEIRVPRIFLPEISDAADRPLPAFLTTPDPEYLSLDEVIPPEAEQVRCSLQAAKHLIEHALTRRMRVRDVLRDMVGLESQIPEEVIFEFPLTDRDYRMLAQRYRLPTDDREAIRSALHEELAQRLPKL